MENEIKEKRETGWNIFASPELVKLQHQGDAAHRVQMLASSIHLASSNLLWHKITAREREDLEKQIHREKELILMWLERI